MNGWSLVAIALYLLATATFIAHVVADAAALKRTAHLLLFAAGAFHTVALVSRVWTFGYEGLGPFPEQLSCIGAIMVAVYLLLALRANLTVVGALVSPIAFLLLLSANVFETGNAKLPPQLESVWLPAHVAPAFLGYAVFAVAFCLSVTYLLQERQLKVKRKGDLFRRLPSLQTLDELNYRFVTWGFALFTVGLITGSFLAKEMWGALWSWEPVQIWSVITWLLYAVLLHARTVGWRGRKAARLTIFCFIVLAVSFVGVNLLFPGKHAGTFG